MTSVIAPPPEVVATLADLMAAIKHVTPKTVADLQAAAGEYKQALNDLAKGNSEAHAKQAKLEKLEASIDAKQAKLDTQKAEQEAKASQLAVSEGNLQSAYTNLQSRTDEFEVYAKAKTEELSTLEAKLNSERDAVAVHLASAIELKADMEAKHAAVKAAMGA